jgi:hypothetical protein
MIIVVLGIIFFATRVPHNLSGRVDKAIGKICLHLFLAIVSMVSIASYLVVQDNI